MAKSRKRSRRSKSKKSRSRRSRKKVSHKLLSAKAASKLTFKQLERRAAQIGIHRRPGESKRSLIMRDNAERRHQLDLF
jgi:hypothetical protein